MTAATPEQPRAAAPSLGAQLLVTTPIRVVLNTAYRMVYPFLPAFSRGLGVPIETLTILISLRSGLGLLAPVFGLVPDRFGRRAALLAGLTVFVAGVGAVVIWPSFLTFCAAGLGVSVAKLLFDPALLAHFGDQTPYHRRGLVIAVSEIGWSGATLAGIPLLGLLLAGGDWRTPFPPLAGLGVAAWLGVWVIIPAGRVAAPAAAPRPAAFFAGVLSVFRSPSLLAALSLGLLAALANELLNVVYGQWMESAFHLKIETLGASVIVIGLAELTGEGAVAALSDRLGKRRLVMLTGLLSAGAYLLLPWLTGSLGSALAGIFLVYCAFEATIVGTLPLLSELTPATRGTLLSTSGMFQAAARMVGSAVGGLLLLRVGFVWVGGLAAALNVGMVLLLWRVVRERV